MGVSNLSSPPPQVHLSPHLPGQTKVLVLRTSRSCGRLDQFLFFSLSHSVFVLHHNWHSASHWLFPGWLIWGTQSWMWNEKDLKHKLPVPNLLPPPHPLSTLFSLAGSFYHWLLAYSQNSDILFREVRWGSAACLFFSGARQHISKLMTISEMGVSHWKTVHSYVKSWGHHLTGYRHIKKLYQPNYLNEWFGSC